MFWEKTYINPFIVREYLKNQQYYVLLKIIADLAGDEIMFKRIVKNDLALIQKFHSDFVEFSTALDLIFHSRGYRGKKLKKDHQIVKVNQFICSKNQNQFFYTVKVDWILYELPKRISIEGRSLVQKLNNIKVVENFVRSGREKDIQIWDEAKMDYQAFRKMKNALPGVSIQALFEDPMIKSGMRTMLDHSIQDSKIFLDLLKTSNFSQLIDYRRAKNKSRTAKSILYLMILFLYGFEELKDTMEFHYLDFQNLNSFNNRSRRICEKYFLE